MIKNRFSLNFAAALVLLVAFAGFNPARAAEDVFTVSAVTVDITAENAVAAREKAFTEAQGSALKALAERLLSPADFAKYTPPTGVALSTMIKDYEITDERISNVQYIGTYTFRFDGPAVRSHFNMRGTRYSDVTPTRAVLVLPFLRRNDTSTILWRGENPWLNAWTQTPQTTNLIPLAVPLGDVADVADIGDDQALNYNTASLSRMLRRYNASDAVILIAAPGVADSNGIPSELQVTVYRTDRVVPQYVDLITLRADGIMSESALYAAAVDRVKSLLNSDWKNKTAVEPGREQRTVSFRVQYSTMQQWVETRQAIRQVQGLAELKVKSVTPREALVDISFSGPETRLRMALEQAGLVMGAENAQPYTLGLGKYNQYQ